MAKPTQTSSENTKDFMWVDTCEPHHLRRKKILDAHPEVKELYGHEPNTKWVILFMVATQLTLAYVLRDSSWYIFVPVAWLIGGIINHSCFLAMHECSHNLAFGNIKYDRLCAIFANIPTVFPAAITFRRYHLEHHQYQGVDVLDQDIPSRFEGDTFKPDSFLSKLCWVLLQSIFYGVRPIICAPKSLSLWEGINVAFQLSVDFLIYYYWGWKAILYLLLSTFLGMGANPWVNGHFISEHYISHPGQETYSYYGPWNLVTFWVGYHNEHHDFSNIPGSRLPLLKKLAPEFYDNLHSYDSWTKVVWWYLTSSAGPYSRVVRTKATHDQARNAEMEEYDRAKSQKQH